MDGTAIVYCEGAFCTPNGKTAHGLVRFTRRYRVFGVVDSRYAGKDAGELLDGKRNGKGVFASVGDALEAAEASGVTVTHLVVGLAPDGGRLSPSARGDLLASVRRGLHLDAGLHDFLSEDAELRRAARDAGVEIRDIRKPPPREALHFFSGKIEAVQSLKLAILGTDSAVGKRTTAWMLVEGLEKRGMKVVLVGTGQTAWMQGARYGLLLDSLVNDFVSGEIEHAVWEAWHTERPDVVVVEGQGSLMNPAYPGGFEILAAARPDVVVLQHAPARRDYDGFPGYPIHPLPRQIQAVEILSGIPVAAVAVNHEDLAPDQVPVICKTLEQTLGIPAFDVLLEGADRMVDWWIRTYGTQKGTA